MLISNKDVVIGIMQRKATSLAQQAAQELRDSAAAKLGRYGSVVYLVTHDSGAYVGYRDTQYGQYLSTLDQRGDGVLTSVVDTYSPDNLHIMGA